ncbi:Isopenicillin N synthase [Vibrio xiamenensis]|uniref:2-oxoglutarate-dependent ethylene/succinate-forming enzyme n=1 Tax=Vibrio xiamenensis TaxID=861298 RepID=A0A1G8B3K1_9VIBR|nr:2-oxoglutarate and iron-dependent oxygenase domain-containing protein [Vibrio xiamenensis]SDH27756.1 Isopenicillin N synthase [Vibrio xiamenensis]
MTQTCYQLDELNFETTIGGRGVEADVESIPMIDLHDFEQRREEITEQLWQAATQVGFFQLTNHGIALTDIEKAFGLSEQFFSLPQQDKQQFPLKEGLNAGWEFKQQVRPSTGTADQKESYQITLPHMDDLWPSEQLVPEFESHLLSMEHQAWQLGMKVLSCFADKLGFERDFFTRAHQRESQDYLSTLRMLHYLPMAEIPTEGEHWRAGAHTDFDCLTMVFQQENQGGLQVAGGKDAKQNLVWSNVVPKAGVITCNIGDMLMRWSDDLLKSTLHRVRMPSAEENQGSRYSMAFFCQANRDQIIQGPQQRYQPITAQEYLKMRINANFA